MKIFDAGADIHWRYTLLGRLLVEALGAARVSLEVHPEDILRFLGLIDQMPISDVCT